MSFARRFVLSVLALVALFLTSGCGDHLAGTHDVELTYAISGAIPTATGKTSPLDLVRSRVEERLAVAHVTADVETEAPNLVRVTIDESSATEVDATLRTPNGLALYRPDDAIKIDAHGPVAAVVNAISAAKLPQGRRALVACDDMSTCRVVVVHDPPAFDLGGAVEATSLLDHGRSVAVRLAPDAVKRVREAPVAEGEKKTWADEPLVIARGRTAFARETIPENGQLVFRFGDDIYSYSRAEQAEALLAAHPIPPMHRTAMTPLPERYGLAILGLVLPLIASLGWLSFVRRFDRAHPEPYWLVLATFALGGLSVVPAGLAEYICMSATPYLNPSVMSLGGQLIGFPLAVAVFTLVVGVSEEGSKLLGAWSLARHRKEFDEPIDGIVYGTASALGFAAVENVKYFAVGRLASSIVVMRSLTSVPVHMFFGAIWGYALGRKLVSKKTSVLLFFLWAAVMHGSFDASLSIRGLFPLAFLLQILLALCFVHFLRKSLRYGVLPKDAEAPPASAERMSVTLGSMSTFAMWVALFLVFAAGLVGVGAYFEASHHRLGYGFMSIAVSMLALLGFAAHGVANSVPLDAVIDVDGVTFAGTSRRWSTIQSIERRPSRFTVLGNAEDVVIHSTEGDVHVGPARRTAADVVAQTIGARLTRA